MPESSFDPLQKLRNGLEQEQASSIVASDKAIRRRKLDEQIGQAFSLLIKSVGPLLSGTAEDGNTQYWLDLSSNLLVFVKGLQEASREYSRKLIHERLERASHSGVPSLETAATLLLSSNSTAEELSAVLKTVRKSKQYELWSAWLPYILDQLISSDKPPLTMLPPIPGATRDDWRRADRAFGCPYFSEQSFDAVQVLLDSANAHVDSAMRSGGYHVSNYPPCRVRDLIGFFDPRALHWYCCDPPPFQFLQPPPSIEMVSEPEESRLKLDEIWTASNSLMIALDQWMEWFAVLQEKKDAQPAVALNCCEMCQRSIRTLLTYRPVLEPFGKATEKEILAMLPPIPSWWISSTEPKVLPLGENKADKVFSPWQQDKEFFDRYYFKPESRSEKSQILRGKASQLVEMLKASPLAVLKSCTVNGNMSTLSSEKILQILNSACLSMEANPRAFSTMNEEHIRDHLLSVLKSHFNDATSESLRNNGSTDILVQFSVESVFVAECKIWKGQKAFSDAIDQLLGYLTWREQHAAIILFVRNKTITDVLNSIENVNHARLTSPFSNVKKGWYESAAQQKYDSGLGVQITLLVFHFPVQ